MTVRGTVEAKWAVFTSAYRKIRTGSAVVTGTARMTWDLLDAAGRPVSNGSYYIRVEAAGQVRLLKVLVLR